MAVVSEEAFRARLAALPADERARFVAELARQRGWSARVEGTTDTGPVVSVARDGRRRRVLIDDPGWPVPFARDAAGGVDAVVTPRDDRPRGVRVPPDVAVIDGGDLYERAVYGIPADARRRLFREHLDLTPGDADAEETGVTGGDRSRYVHLALAVVALATVVVVAIASVSGVPAVDPPRGGGPVDAGGPTLTPFVGSSVDEGNSSTTGAPPPDAYPPGVNESGIVDAAALVDAHTGILEQSDYRLVMTYTEYNGSRASSAQSSPARHVRRAHIGATTRHRLVVTVQTPSRARISVDPGGRAIGIADPIPRTEAYTDGETLYSRIPRENGTVYQRDTFTYPPATWLTYGRSYLARGLAVDSSRLVGTTVRDGTRLFEIGIVGDDDPRTRSVTGWLLVDSRGAIHSFRRRYAADPATTDAPGDVSVSVRLDYEFGNVTVEPPPWLGRARAALGRNDSALVPAPERKNRNAPRTDRRESFRGRTRDSVWSRRYAVPTARLRGCRRPPGSPRDSRRPCGTPRRVAR